MNLCLDLFIYSFISSVFKHNGGASLKKRIDRDNRMDSDGKKVKYLTIILREVDYEDDQKTYGVIVYQQTLVNAKLQIGKRGQKQS
jgi:hypothetical protein